MSGRAVEMNFDGLVGPTHNYAGLSFGNLASARHARSVSNPKQAALEGLAKMKFLADLGIPQGVLPPHERPDLNALRRIGFHGDDAKLVQDAACHDSSLLASVYSASAMWAANAATVSPSADTVDGRVHFTPANLISQFHRSLEARQTSRILRAIFLREKHFAHHDPLPAAARFGDEGAANHTRLCAEFGQRGIELFVYGVTGLRFPARQTLAASQAIARLHQLEPKQTRFIQQSPKAIDAGAFHNDVVAVGNRNVLLYHEAAYENALDLADKDLHLISVSANRISLQDAVETYLFNSQLITLPDGSMSLIAPIECAERENVRAFVDELIAGSSPIKSAHYLDVRQSMHNGGGPACLRLRVVLTDEERARVHSGVVLDESLYVNLVGWVKRHYRERLEAVDLLDPKLIDESRAALDELSQILRLGSIYDFQRA